MGKQQIHNITPDLLPLARPIDSLHEDPENAREHDAENIRAISELYKSPGQMKSIVVLENGRIIAGNGQFQAAKFLGWTHIACTVMRQGDLTPEAFDRMIELYAIGDNRSAELASWKNEMLAAKLMRLREAGVDLQEALSFNNRQLAVFMASLKQAEPEQRDEVGGNRWLLLIECPDEPTLQRLFAEMNERGVECKIMS